MRSNDIQSREELRGLMQQAIKNNDTEGFYDAFDKMMQRIELDLTEKYEQTITDMQHEIDTRVLAARGVRQLTSQEREYYQKLSAAMKSGDPRQAVNNLDVVMPETVINSVFEDLRTEHPLLSHIDFMPTNGAIKVIMNTNGYQEAAWGKLCAKIVEELTSGFKEVDASLLKLTAFLPVCKSMLELGPEWLDKYVREVLYEALANGMEAGIVGGDGNDKPIGMNRQVGDGVTVTGGVYPKKEKIKVNDLSPETVGKLLAIMAIAPNGKRRKVRDVLLIVSPDDYYSKVMPATTILLPDGTYRNNVTPVPMTIIESPSVDPGEAIIGLGRQYFGAAGTATGGNIEYSDHYRFLEDERVYLIKAMANGMPKDNNAFQLLDISELQPLTWKVEQVTRPETEVSSDATLSDLRIGSLALNPAFSADVTEYSVDTENASNTVTAVPADAGAEVAVVVGDKVISNGTAVTWVTGENAVEIHVTAADGATVNTYTVTVNKA